MRRPSDTEQMTSVREFGQEVSRTYGSTVASYFSTLIKKWDGSDRVFDAYYAWSTLEDRLKEALEAANQQQKFHLRDDFGLNKTYIKRKFMEEYEGIGVEPDLTERGFHHTKELLDREDQWYTLDEALEINGARITSHDECVIDNPNNYSNVEVYQAKRLLSEVERVAQLINLIKGKHGNS